MANEIDQRNVTTQKNSKRQGSLFPKGKLLAYDGLLFS